MKKKFISASALLFVCLGSFAQQAVTGTKTPASIPADSTAATIPQQQLTTGSKNASAIPVQPANQPPAQNPPQQAPVSQKKKPE